MTSQEIIRRRIWITGAFVARRGRKNQVSLFQDHRALCPAALSVAIV